ncbi:putative bifunctional diguanylate cyclase/phosphodiesterase [Caldimonas sp. KR1-144]|uniref:putative bifunctional diguanylate cyclase/phosphodiesterase n=1 Tax=Caldimonas sp. KR1-144 TaxID=3400911 RepID=UPI003C07218E
MPTPTIVCIDDDLELLHALREQLQRGLGAACQVELACSGAEALQLIDELAAAGTQVPLVISDHHMPGMSGADLLARVHQRDRSVLTILLTGGADLDTVGRAVNDANLYRLLPKPWQEDDLLRTVREALLRIEHERQLRQHSRELAISHHQLRQSLQLLQATMDATPDGLLVLAIDGTPMHINRPFVELWAVPPALAHPRAGETLLAHLRSRLRDPAALGLAPADEAAGAGTVELDDGRIIEVARRPFRLAGERAGIVLSFRDITEHERSARIIRHQARHDSLSGLPNRLQFSEALELAIVQAGATGGGVAVLFVDLDHFKRVNDTLGHDIGDQLLKCVAERLVGCLRDGDLIARWGGDEFTVLAPRVRSVGEAERLAQRLLHALEDPFEFGEMTVRMSASVGVARFPDDGRNGADLLRRADMALYRVKDDGRNGFELFRPSAFSDIDGSGGLSLEAELRHAIANNELTLHYQPQFDSRSGLITGVEALARWHHPARGWISPSVFIPIAEYSGSILALGEWVLQSACRQAARWRAQGHASFRMAVNLAAAQFDRTDLEAIVKRALHASGLAPEALELEITESAALRQMGHTATKLAALQRLGVRIALDDFGTGHASLAYLKQLPCDTLKIDRSFIAGVHENGKDTAIVRALLALAEGLGLHVVAEGVETRKTAQALHRLGCWTMQGYLLGRPMSAEDLSSLLRPAPPAFIDTVASLTLAQGQ